MAGASGASVPGPDTPWTASGGPLTPTSPVTLTWDNGQGLVFTRTISVDENYMFTVRDAVRNSTGAPVTLSPYGLVSRTGTPHVSGYYILHEGPVGYLAGSLREPNYSSLKPGEPQEYTSTGGWLGFTDKYWLTALVPPQEVAVKARFSHRVEDGGDRYQTDYLAPPVTVPAEGTAETAVRFFAGAKEVNLLDAYADVGHSAFRPGDRFRLVLLPDQADFPDPAMVLRADRQFRAGHPAADAADQAAVLSSRQQILSRR